MSRELKVRLLNDVGNKAKTTVMMMKGNRAAKLINKKDVVLAKEDEPINIIYTKEAKENIKSGKKVIRVRSVGEKKK